MDHDELAKIGDDFVSSRAPDEDEVDVPESAEKWKRDTKGVERILSVATSLGEPRTASWIAQEALVSEQTARDHLETFVDEGIIAKTTASGVTRYQADEAFLHYREVSKLVKQYSKDELIDIVEELRTAIDDLKSEFEVDTPDQLRARAAGDDTELELIREYKKRASVWETLQDRVAVAEDAISRYEKFGTAGSVAA